MRMSLGVAWTIGLVCAAPAMAQCTPGVLGHIGGEFDQVVYRNGRLFTTSGGGDFRVYNATTLTLVGQTYIPGAAKEIDLDGAYAYVAAGDAGLFVIDISSPTTPSLVTIMGIHADDVTIANGKMYVITDGDAVIYDIANPLSPVQKGTCTTAIDAWTLASDGNTVYVGTFFDIVAFDTTNPLAPVQLGTWPSGHILEDMVYKSGTLAVAHTGGTSLVDVTSPNAMTQTSLIPGLMYHTAMNGSATTLAVSNSLSTSVYDITNHAAPVLGASLVNSAASDLTMNGGTLYDATLHNGLHVHDVSTPASPVLTGTITRQPATPRALATIGTTLISTDVMEFEVFDVSVPSAAVRIATIVTADDVLDIVASGARVYGAGVGGFFVYDFTTPTAPVLVGSVPGFLGSARLALSGTTVFVHTSDGVLHLFDVTNPAAPYEMSQIQVSGSISELVATGSTAYVSNEPLGGVTIVDASNPFGPVVAGQMASGLVVTHLALGGGVVSAADSAGVIHFADVSAPLAPVPVGSYAAAGQVSGLGVFDTLLVADIDRSLWYVDVSDAASPQVVSVLHMGASVDGFVAAGPSLWGVHDHAGVWGADLPNYARVRRQPDSVLICPGATAQFAVTSPNAGATYRWYKNAAPMGNGPTGTGSVIQGATSPTLRILNTSGADVAPYHCVVHTGCSDATTRSVTIAFKDPDLNQDGTADQDDVAYLIDVVAGGPNPTGIDPDLNQDGSADQDDVAALVNWIAGGACP